jgi:hypothetical protein
MLSLALTDDFQRPALSTSGGGGCPAMAPWAVRSAIVVMMRERVIWKRRADDACCLPMSRDTL